VSSANCGGTITAAACVLLQLLAVFRAGEESDLARSAESSEPTCETSSDPSPCNTPPETGDDLV
jgi:hypothetical protein